MRKAVPDERKICPVCKSTDQQIRIGCNRSGTQRCLCRKCGKKYTIDPKKHEYSEEIKKIALELHENGMSGRSIGKILGMNKANVYNWIRKK